MHRTIPTDKYSMAKKPPKLIVVDLEADDEPWEKIQVTADPKNGTVLVTFNGKVAVNLDASAALELAAEIHEAAEASLGGPAPGGDGSTPD